MSDSSVLGAQPRRRRTDAPAGVAVWISHCSSMARLPSHRGGYRNQMPRGSHPQIWGFLTKFCGLQFWSIPTKMAGSCRGSSAMRISDDRYHRERLRMELALRFLRHEARTQTIRAWTGLSDDRIRKLYRSYLGDARGELPRHRGKSPHQVAYFTRSAAPAGGDPGAGHRAVAARRARRTPTPREAPGSLAGAGARRAAVRGLRGLPAWRARPRRSPSSTRCSWPTR